MILAHLVHTLKNKRVNRCPGFSHAAGCGGRTACFVADTDVGLAILNGTGSTIVLQIEMALMMETDPSAIINELIYAVRKGGHIGVVGVYAGFCNHFNIGGCFGTPVCTSSAHL